MSDHRQQTDEIPAPNGMRCLDCNTSIRLTENKYGLLAECDCRSKSIQIGSKKPEAWAE